MPNVRFAGRTIPCEDGANLRRTLLDVAAELYASPMQVLNCRGLGTCGTCAIEVLGAEGSVSAPTSRERWRLGFAPHHPGNAPVDPNATLRLACQVHVHGDLRCVRRSGAWGQGASPMER